MSWVAATDASTVTRADITAVAVSVGLVAASVDIFTASNTINNLVQAYIHGDVRRRGERHFDQRRVAR